MKTDDNNVSYQSLELISIMLYHMQSHQNKNNEILIIVWQNYEFQNTYVPSSSFNI